MLIAHRPRKKTHETKSIISSTVLFFMRETMDGRGLDWKEAQINGNGTRQRMDKSRGRKKECFVEPNQRCGLLFMTIYIVVRLTKNWN